MNTIKSFLGTALLFIYTLVSAGAPATPPPPPSNDNSANATVISHAMGCSANAAYTTVGATADGTKPSKWASGPSNNVWFKFQATATVMSADLKVQGVEGTLRSPRLSLHNSTLTEILSTDENGTTTDIGFSYDGLTIGDWYYLQVDNLNVSIYVGTFTLCLQATPSMDLIAGAKVVPHNQACSAGPIYNTNIGTPDGTRPAGWQMGPNNNVWFKFQATATGVALMAKTGSSEGTSKRLSIALYDASMNVVKTAPSNNATYDDVGFSHNNLTIGNWYYVSVDNGDLQTDRGTFIFCIAALTNHDYAATAKQIGITESCVTSNLYTTMMGSPDGTKPTNWSIGPTSNLWFKFIATETMISIDLKVGGSEGTMQRPKLALYDASLTELISVDEGGSTADIGLSSMSLTVGQTYYINVDNGDLYYERGTFTLCLSTMPSCDYPYNPNYLNEAGNWCSGNAAFTTLIGTPDGPKPSRWSNGPNANVYFLFYATSTTISAIVKTGGAEGTIKRPRLALLDGALTELKSQGDNGSDYSDVGLSYDNLVIDSIYYLMVDNGNSQHDRGTFTLCVNSDLGQDYPAGAVELTDLNSWCSSLGAYTTLIGSPDGTRPTAWTYGPTNNVWFKFQAQRHSITINVKTGDTEGTLKRPNVSLHNSSMAYVAGEHDNGANNDIALTYNTLTVGDWYYLQVDNGDQVGDPGSFTLCVDNGLPAPTSLAASPTGGQNELVWTYTGTDQTGFEIQRSTTAGTGYTTVGTVGSTVLQYADATATGGTLYYYRVRATTSTLLSLFSPEVSVLTSVASPHNITWTTVVGATTSGSTVTKTAAAGWGNAGAESTDRLGDNTIGWIRYPVTSITAGEFYLGFSDLNLDNQPGTIRYAFHLTNAAQTYVEAEGSQMFSFNVTAGDVLQLERRGSDLRFMQNGTVIYTIHNGSLGSMIVDASLKTASAQIAGVTVNFLTPPETSHKIVWSPDIEGVLLNNDSTGLRKTSESGYGNAGGSSINKLMPNKDGWMEFALDALNKDKAVGLATGTAYDLTLDYAFVIESNSLNVYSGGINRATVSGAAVNDVLRIWRIGDHIYWMKNGVVVYSSLDASVQDTLFVDMALNTNDGVLISPHTSFDIGEGLVPDQVEFLALKALYDNLGGNNWGQKTNWPAGSWPATATWDQFGQWRGIVIENHDIKTLSLSSNHLVGTVPAAIGDLKGLQALSLGGNTISGLIPPEIGNLPNLMTLDLDGNQLTGSIPSTFANFQHIYSISVFSNQLSGSIPSFLFDLPEIGLLYLSNNAFTGSIPSNIDHAKRIYEINFSFNQLTGTIPPSLGNMPFLSSIKLNNNQLTGTLPSTFANFEYMGDIEIGNNNLSGPLPEEIGRLTTLVWLDLSNNHFTGPIPASYANNVALNVLRLDHNELSGAVPQELGNLSNLRDVRLGYNNFTSLPSNFVYKSTMSLSIPANKFDFSDLEPLYSSAGHTIFGLGLDDSNMQKPETPDEIDVPTGGMLTITAANPGAHTTIDWYFIPNPSGTPVHVNSTNADVTQHTFKISNFQASNEGQYYYVETNTWVVSPSSVLTSEIAVVKMVDPFNTTFNPDKLYNGSIGAMRWRTDAPYATGDTDLAGIYLFKYDNKNQLSETQFATSGVGNAYTLAGNTMRVNNIAYDPNGNILSMNRYDKNGIRIHAFEYTYNSGGSTVQHKNQLESIAGHATYSYNEIGQMAGEDNTGEDDQYVDYDIAGRVVAVYSDASKSPASLKVTYRYDERGFRMAKANHQTNRMTWYIRDAAGSVANIFESSFEDNTTNRTEVPIHGASKLGTLYPGTNEGEGIMAYEITDHLGNVRAIVEDRIIEYKATMEDNGTASVSNPRVTEDYYFKNIWETEQVDQDMNHSSAIPGIVDSPNSSAYLYWDDNSGTMDTDKGIGPGITLKVGPGDVINIDTWARYQEETTYARDFTQTVFASLLGGTFVTANGIDNLGTITSYFENGIGATGVFQRGTDDSKPYAYLNYMLFDDAFTLQKAGSLRVDEDGEFSPGEEALHNFDHLEFSPVTVDASGYIYVWVSNESKGTKVWFDDLKVVHRGAMVSQATDYDPWGYVQRQEKTDGELIYRFGYQGQNSEKDDETGWNHFNAREYDPVIGRWLSMDPNSQFFSPYLPFGNNPVISTDPDGKDAIVIINGSNITIKSQIYIYGSGADSRTATIIQAEIMTDWGGPWKYTDPKTGQVFDVTFDVSVKFLDPDDPTNVPDVIWDELNPLSTNNYIEVGATPADISRSFVMGGDEGKWRSWRGSGYRGFPFSHEFGHLIGLKDRYTDAAGTDPAWKGTIMGEAAEEGLVNQKVINGLVAPLIQTLRAFQKSSMGRMQELNLEPTHTQFSIDEADPKW